MAVSCQAARHHFKFCCRMRSHLPMPHIPLARNFLMWMAATGSPMPCLQPRRDTSLLPQQAVSPARALCLSATAGQQHMSLPPMQTTRQTHLIAAVRSIISPAHSTLPIPSMAM